MLSRPTVEKNCGLDIRDLPYWICLAGAQPMMSQDGRWVTVFNGEIYNHLDIRNELQEHIPEVTFRGHSDTETL